MPTKRDSITQDGKLLIGGLAGTRLCYLAFLSLILSSSLPRGSFAQQESEPQQADAKERQGRNILANGDFSEGSKGWRIASGTPHFAVEPSPFLGGSPAGNLFVPRSSRIWWDQQLRFDVGSTRAQPYAFSFTAFASTTSTLLFDIKPQWDDRGGLLHEGATLDIHPRRFSFPPVTLLDGPMVIVFGVEHAGGSNIWLDDVSLIPEVLPREGEERKPTESVVPVSPKLPPAIPLISIDRSATAISKEVPPDWSLEPLDGSSRTTLQTLAQEQTKSTLAYLFSPDTPQLREAISELQKASKSYSVILVGTQDAGEAVNQPALTFARNAGLPLYTGHIPEGERMILPRLMLLDTDGQVMKNQTGWGQGLQEFTNFYLAADFSQAGNSPNRIYGHLYASTGDPETLDCEGIPFVFGERAITLPRWAPCHLKVSVSEGHVKRIGFVTLTQYAYSNTQLAVRFNYVSRPSVWRHCFASEWSVQATVEDIELKQGIPFILDDGTRGCAYAGIVENPYPDKRVSSVELFNYPGAVIDVLALTVESPTQFGTPSMELSLGPMPTRWYPVNTNCAEFGFYDGVGWYCRRIRIPDDWPSEGTVLQLSWIDDDDTTYFNSVKVGGISGYKANRIYEVEVKPGEEATILIRVQDTGGIGGLLKYHQRYPSDIPEFVGLIAGDRSIKLPFDNFWFFAYGEEMPDVSEIERIYGWD